MPDTPDDTALRTLVDPAIGVVLGYAWGSSAENFLADHPGAELVREDGDVQDWLLPEPLLVFGVPARALFQFSVDALVTLTLAFDADVIDDEAVAELVEGVAGWFDADPEEPEDGLLVFEEPPTRLAIDFVEGRMVFADMEL